MNFIFRIFFIFIIILQCLLSSAVIHPNKSITITFKEGFITHLNTKNEFGKIKNCWYKIGGGSEKLIKLDSIEPHKIESGEIILPYSKTKCGIRVDQVSFAASTTWTLKAESNNGEIITGKLEVSVRVAPRRNFEKLIEHQLGRVPIECSQVHQNIDPRYCTIYDNIGILSESCKPPYTFIVRNKTQIKCNTLTWFSLLQSTETFLIEPIILKPKTIVQKTDETDDFLTMTCQFPNKISYCKAEYPNKIDAIFITDGLATGRFTSLDTKTDEGKCVLEIKKPFLPNEIGIWHISNEQGADKQSGCVFYVGEKKAKLIQNYIKQPKPIETIEFINNYQSKKINLKCEAPYPVDVCYILDPKNNIHFSEQPSKSLGFCEFSLDLIPGEYICGLSGEYKYQADFIHKYKINVINETGEAVTPLIETNLGESIEMLCRIPGKVIELCAFIDPQREVYYVSNFIKSKENSRLSYFGNGIEQGHCGIKIDKIQASDFGTWKCHFNKDSTFEIHVEKIKYSLSQASTYGLGFGLGGAFVVFIIGLIHYFRKRNNLQTQNDDSVEEPIQMIRSASIQSANSFTSKES